MGGINPWNLIRSMKSIDQWQQTVNANVVGSVKTGYKQFDIMLGGDVTTNVKPSTESTNGIQLPEQTLVPVSSSIDFSQGEIVADNDWTHLAIYGDGFFMTTSNISAPDPNVDICYTRDGTFHLDEEGFLRTKEGLYVLDGTQIPGDPNLQATSVPPWDSSIFADWSKREKLRIKDPDHNLTANTVVEYTVDTSKIYNNGFCNSDLSDLRIGYYNQSTSTWESIPCQLDSTSPNSDTKLRFRLKDDLNVGDDISGKYYLFYNYDGSSSPVPLGVTTPTLSFDDKDVAKNEFNITSQDVAGNSQSVISFTNITGAETWRTGPADSPSDTWAGVTNKGNIDYVKGTGYVINQTAAGNNEIYRISDGMGGWTFVDQGSIDPTTMEIIAGMEIMMTVIKDTNVNPTTMAQLTTVDYDLELSTNDIDNYTIFNPATIYDTYGSVPNLKTVNSSGTAVSIPYNRGTNSWGPYTYDDGTGMLITITTPYVSGGGITEGDSSFVPGADTDVWAGTSATNNNYNYLTVRKPIYISKEGLIRDNAPINISGFADQDVSVYLRTASGALVPIYEDGTYKQGNFNGSIDPSLLEVGTNYLEVYSSKEVVSPPNVPAYSEDFSSYTQGDYFKDTGLSDGWTVGGTDPSAWRITSSEGVGRSAGQDPGAPASLGNILYSTTNTNNFVYRGDSTWDNYTFSSTLARTATDNDLIKVWVRVDNSSATAGPRSGYVFFIQGDGDPLPGTDINYDRVGIARADWNGSSTTYTVLATCNKNSPAYSPTLDAWQRLDTSLTTLASYNTETDADGFNRNNGFIDLQEGPGGGNVNYAQHWNIRIDADGDQIKVYLSDEGTHTSPAPAVPATPTFTVTDTAHPTGKFALQTDSQEAWFDNISFSGIKDSSGNTLITAGLRIDDTSLNNVQSIESFESMSRYYTANGKVYDRFGTATKANNDNQFMTSNADGIIGTADDENFIDYNPNTTTALQVGNLDDIPILDGRLVQYTKNPGSETRIAVSTTTESPVSVPNPYEGSNLWTEYQATFKMGVSDQTATTQKVYTYIRENGTNNWVRMEYDNKAQTLKLQKRVNGGAIVDLQTVTGFKINEPTNIGGTFIIKAEGQNYTIQTVSGTNKTVNWQIRDTSATGGGLAPLYGNLAFGNTCSAWYDDLIIKQLAIHKDITTLGDGLVKPDDAESLLAQMNVVVFPANDGLKYSTKYGSVYFNKTDATGTSHSEQSGQNGAGTIRTNSLEASNVDLASQLTGLGNSKDMFSILSKQFEIFIGNIDATLNLFR